MSDGWFDRSYRSNEAPPAELDARVLAAARRATRRWTLPALAAAALIAAAVLILGLLVTGHQLHVPAGEPPCPPTLEVGAPAQSATALDGADLLVAGVRYRCTDGQWSRVENPAPG